MRPNLVDKEARKWGMRFQPVKCNMMQLTRKHLNKIQASFTLEGTALNNVDNNIKYLGVTITNDLKWNTHILEKVQNRAARFVTRNYVYETGSMTGILGQLKMESLKKRRKDNRLIFLYKGLKGKARIPTDDLIPKTRRGRNQHSMAFQIPSASKDVYKNSFFPQTIRDWNDLPESLISSSELSDDSVSKFTYLVRARDLFPPVTAHGEGLSIWHFTSKLFRFRSDTAKQ